MKITIDFKMKTLELQENISGKELLELFNKIPELENFEIVATKTRIQVVEKEVPARQPWVNPFDKTPIYPSTPNLPWKTPFNYDNDYFKYTPTTACGSNFLSMDEKDSYQLVMN
jgi:hypothetical protein